MREMAQGERWIADTHEMRRHVWGRKGLANDGIRQTQFDTMPLYVIQHGCLPSSFLFALLSTQYPHSLFLRHHHQRQHIWWSACLVWRRGVTCVVYVLSSLPQNSSDLVMKCCWCYLFLWARVRNIMIVLSIHPVSSRIFRSYTPSQETKEGAMAMVREGGRRKEARATESVVVPSRLGHCMLHLIHPFNDVLLYCDIVHSVPPPFPLQKETRLLLLLPISHLFVARWKTVPSEYLDTWVRVVLIVDMYCTWRMHHTQEMYLMYYPSPHPTRTAGAGQPRSLALSPISRHQKAVWWGDTGGMWYCMYTYGDTTMKTFWDLHSITYIEIVQLYR